MMEVPFIDLKASNRALKAEILPLWEEILETASFVGGRQVLAFEEEFAAACGVGHSVAVSSGTDALRFIFMGLGVRPGDEIITSPNTFVATTGAIIQAGAKPVLADVDPRTYTIDPSRIAGAIGPRTRGIVPVHLYGQTAEMDAITSLARRHGLWIVEDAAQAHLAGYKGRRAGALGTAAAFSFYPGKNLGACGEAGAVTTNDKALAERVRMIRDHGQAVKHLHEVEGTNGRCDALQAAALRVKLKLLPAWNKARRNNARLYFDFLRDAEGVVLPEEGPGRLHVYHLFVVQVENRAEVTERLRRNGIATGLHYPVPIHLQKAYAFLGLREGAFPVTEGYTKKALSLPMYPELERDRIAYTCDVLRKAVS